MFCLNEQAICSPEPSSKALASFFRAKYTQKPTLMLHPTSSEAGRCVGVFRFPLPTVLPVDGAITAAKGSGIVFRRGRQAELGELVELAEVNAGHAGRPGLDACIFGTVSAGDGNLILMQGVYGR